jgi:hypothetical protein
MTDRLATVTRLALLALAQFYAAGKVTIVELFTEHAPAAGETPHQTPTVNVDVTGRAELRDQLADAIINCDVYHVHEPSCYPWEMWTTDAGGRYRGMVGQLLTMWVRIEEFIGFTPQPAASDPAAVPGVPTSIPAPRDGGHPHWLDTGAGWGYDVPAPRPPVVNEPAPPVDYAFPSYREWLRNARPIDLGDVTGTVGIARVDAAPTEPHPLAVLLDDRETASALTPMDWPTPAESPHTGHAWRKWAMAAIEQDARTGGPYPDYTSALAAVRSHPAVKSIEPEDVVSLAYGLVAPPSRNRGRRWSFRSMLPGVAE